MEGGRRVSFLAKVVICLAILGVNSALFVATGLLMNKLVMSANGGPMPSARAESDRLGTIILFSRSEKCELLSEKKPAKGRHTKFTPATKFPLLAGRFPLRMPNECEVRALPQFLETEVRRVKLVSETGWGIASIGDFLQWIGIFGAYIFSLIATLVAPFVIAALLRSLRKNASS